MRAFQLTVLATFLTLSTAASASPAPQSTNADATDWESEPAVQRAVEDMCGRDLVFLGEAAEHGGGRTWQLKGYLLHRLIEDCGFDAVVFESGMYEFFALEEKLATGEASRDDLANAVGALWSAAAENQDWITRLFAQAEAGQIRLAGMDDQISSTAVFVQQSLPAVLAGHLPDDTAAGCAEALDRHFNWRYDESRGYTPAVHEQMVACLDAAAEHMVSPADAKLQAMATGLAGTLRRETLGGRLEQINDRDRSMADRLVWHLDRLPEDAKVVVWCATVHAARSLEGVEGMETRHSLGTYLDATVMETAAVLGISAAGGSYGRPGQPERPLPEAPLGSLEHAALRAGGHVGYLDRASLRGLGKAQGRALDASDRRARWSDVIDGLLVLREEAPASSS